MTTPRSEELRIYVATPYVPSGRPQLPSRALQTLLPLERLILHRAAQNAMSPPTRSRGREERGHATNRHLLSE